jgi:hypothetical protein
VRTQLDRVDHLQSLIVSDCPDFDFIEGFNDVLTDEVI